MHVLYLLHKMPEYLGNDKMYGAVHVPKMGGPETCTELANSLCEIMKLSECSWMIPGTVDPNED